MTDVDEHIKRVSLKLQQLLKLYQQLQKENAQLNVVIAEMQQKEADSQARVNQLEQQVAILKSSAGQLTETDKKSFEKNINQYIREIDKCIGLLSE